MSAERTIEHIDANRRSQSSVTGWATWRGPKIENRLDLFAFLLAFAMTIHHHPAGFETHFTTPFMPIITISAIGLMLRPSSTPLLLVLVVASIGDGVMLSPSVPNHYTLLIITFSVIAIGAAAQGVPKRERLEPLILGVAAMSFAVTFIAAAVHKMNSGFFDRAIGCAVAHFADLTDTIPYFPRVETSGLFSDTLTVVTLVAELGIAVLVFVKRARAIALVSAAVFGIVMAFNGHPAFSALCMCLYVPFIPRQLPSLMSQDAERGGWRSWVLPSMAVTGIAIFVVGAVAGIADIELGNAVLSRLPYLLLAPPFFLLMFSSWRLHRPEGDPKVIAADATTRVAVGSVLLILVANSAMPYLGIRSTGTFSMFSNLRAEASVDRWNHLVIPASVQVFDTHDEWVEILDPTPVRPHVMFGNEGKYRNLFELRRVISQRCEDGTEVPVRYRSLNSGEVYRTDNGCDEPIGEPIGWWAQKLISFRPIADPNVCLL